MLPILFGTSLLLVAIALVNLLATLLLVTREPERWPVWLGAVVLAWLASAVILYFAGNLRKVLGERGLTALERLMGMLLVIVAGHIDLSVGSVVGFVGAVAAVLTVNLGWPVWAVVPACPTGSSTDWSITSRADCRCRWRHATYRAACSIRH